MSFVLCVAVFVRAEDTRVCATCHADIAASYAKTGMARSFSSVLKGEAVRDFSHRSSGEHYAMFERDGRCWQRRWTAAPGGGEENVIEWPVDAEIGSGNHARTFLTRTSQGTLIELPLGWYAENGGQWGMNPSYDVPHPPQNRAIAYECMFCHNGYPRIPDAAARNNEPRYEGGLPQGIDCSRCHGSGAQHVSLAGTAGATPDAIRGAIVNPARLTKERQMEVCMQCHLETTSTPLPSLVRLPGREPFSFAAGEPLGAFTFSFDHAPGSGREDKFEVAGAAYRLRQSRCFLATGDELTCTTCHNPHDTTRGAEASSRYSAACANCHRTLAAAHPRNTECTSCHMPKRRTDDAVHVTMTDHRIQLPPGDPALFLAPKAESHEDVANRYRGEPVLYYPAFAPDTPAARLAIASARGIDALRNELTRTDALLPETWLALADALRDAKRNSEALDAYAHAVKLNPECGRCWREAGTLSHSATALERALHLNPDDARAWLELGILNFDLSALRKAASLAPEMAEAQNAIGVVLLKNRSPEAAEKALRESLRLDPNYAAALANLARLLVGTNRVDEALRCYARAATSEPDWAANRFDYAVTLIRANRLTEAEQQARAAVSADAALADARELLGGLLMRRGARLQAIPEFEAALKIRPGFVRAQYDLGVALAAEGRRNEALTHLRAAAAGTDPAVRAAASAALSQLSSAERPSTTGTRQ